MLSSIEVPNVCLKAGFRVAVVSRRNGFQISGKSFTKKLFLEKARSYTYVQHCRLRSNFRLILGTRKSVIDLYNCTYSITKYSIAFAVFQIGFWVHCWLLHCIHSLSLSIFLKKATAYFDCIWYF